MTLTEMFNICDNCVYTPCLCGNEPENCVDYAKRRKVKVDKEDEHEISEP